MRIVASDGGCVGGSEYLDNLNGSSVIVFINPSSSKLAGLKGLSL